MTGRERFLAALARQPLERPPVWLMRQAGRYLPEYRELKTRHPFTEMVRTPELAEAVTLQPLRRFPLDAAILFSDILVVPEALGQAYRFREGGGIEMAFAIRTADDLKRLDAGDLAARLDYQSAALLRLQQSLEGQVALLGFAGAPWTLATYMIEGGSSAQFSELYRLLYTAPDVIEALLETLTGAVITCLRAQLRAGADAVQLFESWAGACPGPLRERCSTRWLLRIVEALKDDGPVIVFHRGAHPPEALARHTAVAAVSLDTAEDLHACRAAWGGDVVLQGNLDPQALTFTPGIAAAQTQAVLAQLSGDRGHIFNLGHGLTPQATPENVAAVVEAVQRWPHEG